jgi:hypothetical protein
VIGVLGVGQDITQRKMMEIEKTNVAQELQTFIDTANAPIFGCDVLGCRPPFFLLCYSRAYC